MTYYTTLTGTITVEVDGDLVDVDCQAFDSDSTDSNQGDGDRLQSITYTHEAEDFTLRVSVNIINGVQQGDFHLEIDAAEGADASVYDVRIEAVRQTGDAYEEDEEDEHETECSVAD